MRRRNFIVAGAGYGFGFARAVESAIAPIAAYERASRGRVGVFAKNIRTGATLSWRANDRVLICSTFKAFLAALVLERIDQGMDRLAFWRKIGDAVSRLDQVEPELNRTPDGMPENTTTPAAMASTLQVLVLGPCLSERSRHQLANWLVGCQTGFHRLRAGMPARWVIDDKTGNNGLDAAGDIAIAWPSQPIMQVSRWAFARSNGSPTVRDRVSWFPRMAAAGTAWAQDGHGMGTECKNGR